MTLSLDVSLARDAFQLRACLELPGKGVSVLFGPSGCGKTSLLRILAGLEREAEGTVRFGASVWQAPGHFEPPHRRRVGYVFQHPGLFPHLSVQDNLDYGRRRTRSPLSAERCRAITDMLGIGHLLTRKPHRLSGGEQQRVAIARALFLNPALLLMDEPLSALDEARKGEILPFLERLHQEAEMPIVYVSHSTTEVARLADYLVVMDRGVVTAHGPALALFSDPDSPLAARQDASVVISARVAGYDETYCLNHLRMEGGDLYLPGESLPPATMVRVQIHARDVSLTLTRPGETSILNVLAGQVEGVDALSGAHVMVTVRAGQSRLFSRITRRSADALGLCEGKPVYAQVKSVALV